MSSEEGPITRVLADAFMASGWAGSHVRRSQFTNRDEYERALNAYALDLAAVVFKAFPDGWAKVNGEWIRITSDGVGYGEFDREWR